MVEVKFLDNTKQPRLVSAVLGWQHFIRCGVGDHKLANAKPSILLLVAGVSRTNDGEPEKYKKLRFIFLGHLQTYFVYLTLEATSHDTINHLPKTLNRTLVDQAGAAMILIRDMKP